MATKKELERIQTLIGRVGTIAERWQADADISDMERELMLDKLRALYEEVLFLDREEFAEELAAVEAPEAEVPPVIIPEPAPEPPMDELPQPEPEPELALEPEPEDDADEKVDLEPVGGEVVVEETVEETVVEEAVVWEAPNGDEDEEIAAPVEEPATPRNKAAQDLIRTLYGDMPAQGGARQPQPEPEVVPETPADPEPAPVPETPAGAAAPRAAHAENGNGKVLGEVIGGHPQAVNEVLGKQNAHEDVASRLRAGSVTDLRHSIGLNDRFLIISELFGGDADAYEKVIDTLDAFTDLDDAMIHIQENYDWRPDAESTLLLVDLLERKLEQR